MAPLWIYKSRVETDIYARLLCHFFFFLPRTLLDPNETSHCLASMFNTCRGSILFQQTLRASSMDTWRPRRPSVGCWILHCEVPPRDRPPLWSSREFSFSAALGINGGSKQRMKWILFLCFFVLFFECKQSRMDRIQLECNVWCMIIKVCCVKP